MFLENINTNFQLFNISLWHSFNRLSPDVGTFNNLGIHPIVTILLICLAFLFLTIVLSGFSFYLWFYMTSDDQSKCRLLNILNAYLALTCIGGSLMAFYIMMTSALGYEDGAGERALAGFNMTAITGSFLLVSVATILNHFMPSLYLDISVTWRHWIALPSILVTTILIRALVFTSCGLLDKDCDLKRLRTFVLLPSSVITFLLKLIVIIDDYWGWKNIFHLNTNAVIPINNSLQDPALLLDRHLVSMKSMNLYSS